jgi:hypothetical protein
MIIFVLCLVVALILLSPLIVFTFPIWVTFLLAVKYTPVI